MSSKFGTPKAMNLPRLISEYGDEHKCRQYLEAIRWPDGTKCPRDGKNATWLGTVEVWECNSCHYQFTVRVGSVLQDSKLPLSKWLIATFLIVEAKKGVSANQLRRTLGTTYKTAWYLSHRIREAMVNSIASTPLTGTVEVDETYIGGKKSGTRGLSQQDKTKVIGLVERDGRVYAEIVKDVRKATLIPAIRKHVAVGATVYTDELKSYKTLPEYGYTHGSVSHFNKEWVRGDVHTNTVESVWSLFKRSIVGSYHHLSVKHLNAYLDEMEWRYNNRHSDFLFRDTLRALFKSKVLTYKGLTARPA